MIEEELYQEIRARLPIACVDLIVVHENKYLLLKRLHSPAKGQWWFPGGRIFKGETIAEACRRKGQEELGLDLDAGDVVSVEESIFRDEDPMIHTINIVVRIFLKGSLQKIKLDNDAHAEHRWFDTIVPGLHPCVSDPLFKFGFPQEDSVG